MNLISYTLFVVALQKWVVIMAVVKLFKSIFLIFQFIFLLLGLGVVALGTWLELEFKSFQELTSSSQFQYGPYLVIVAGGAVVILAVVGIIGACCESKINKFLLGLYVLVTFLFLVGQLVGAILAVVFREQAESIAKTALNESLMYYESNDNVKSALTEVWDEIQRKHKCCGINSAQDWIGHLTNSSYVFPQSCCQNTSNTDCGKTVDSIADAYGSGCLNTVVSIIKNSLMAVAVAGAVVVVIQLVLTSLAVCLLCLNDYDG